MGGLKGVQLCSDAVQFLAGLVLVLEQLLCIVLSQPHSAQPPLVSAVGRHRTVTPQGLQYCRYVWAWGPTGSAISWVPGAETVAAQRVRYVSLQVSPADHNISALDS